MFGSISRPEPGYLCFSKIFTRNIVANTPRPGKLVACTSGGASAAAGVERVTPSNERVGVATCARGGRWDLPAAAESRRFCAVATLNLEEFQSVQPASARLSVVF